MSTNPSQDLRRKKRESAAQGNPELSIGDPGTKRQSKIGLMAEQLSVPDAKQTMEGVKRIQNDSENKSKDDSNNMLAYTGGWGKLLNEVFASENQSAEFKEQKTNLSTSSTETEPPLEDPDIKTSGNVAGFIAGFEGFRSTPYDDVGKLAIGYGTKASGPNQKITKEQALKAMDKDIKIAKEYVLKAKKKHRYNWSDNQVDALTSFTYNAGPKNLNKLIEDGTRGDEEISYMILEYNTSDGKELEGLTKRRKAEAELFTQGYKKED